MPVSAKVAIILEQNRPSRVTPQLRRIWSDVEALRKAGYRYTEIVNLLRMHYGIEVSYKSFMSARRRIEGGPARATRTAIPGREEAGAMEARAAEDPFARARQKLAADQRTAEVLAGKVR